MITSCLYKYQYFFFYVFWNHGKSLFDTLKNGSKGGLYLSSKGEDLNKV